MYGTVCDECEQRPPIVQCSGCGNDLCGKCYRRHEKADLKQLISKLVIA